MSKEMFAKTGKRGRPQIILNYPPQGKFTINKLVELNPHVTCRLSLYTHVKKLIKKGVLRYTGQTVKTGGVGKPLDILESMANFRRARSVKAAMKARKLASVPPVDLDSVPASVAPETPVAA